MTKFVWVLALLLFFTAPSHGQISEEKLVKKAFDNYKSAILGDKGEEALKSISNRTVQYYSDIIDVVKTADSARIDSLSLIDKITIFSIRHRATREEITAMNGPGLFVYAIKKGMVGKSSVAHNTIGEVTIDKEFAKGQLVANGEKAPLYFHFYKETGEWKLDLTSLFPISNQAFRKMVEDSGENENEYLFKFLRH